MDRTALQNEIFVLFLCLFSIQFRIQEHHFSSEIVIKIVLMSVVLTDSEWASE